MQSLPGLMVASYLARDGGVSVIRDKGFYSNLNTSLDFAAAFAIFFQTPTRKTAPTKKTRPKRAIVRFGIELLKEQKL